MSSILETVKKYSKKIDALDLELIISEVIKKPREFVLAHPEYKIVKNQKSKIKSLIARRVNDEPLAYILGEKEFYGLKFKVDKNTLIPRPETEQLVELALDEISNIQYPISNYYIMDIGTGSGNIIISIAKQLKNLGFKNYDLRFFGVDTSSKALEIARHNARKHKVDKKIKFIRGNLLSPFKKILNRKSKFLNLIITANLPYLSQKIYSSADVGVKKYEPKSALLSANHGLAHYEKLLKQIKKINTLYMIHDSCYLEISPEQKPRLAKMIKKYFPKAKINFFKDLAGKWRVCRMTI